MSDPLRDVAALLLGEQAGEEFSKKQMTPKEREKFQRRQAQIGLASNAVGMTAGAAGLSAALKDDRLASGGKVSRKLYAVGTGSEKLARKTKAGSSYYKWVTKPGVAPKLAAGAVALQGANLAGDAVANRVLARASKEPKKKKTRKDYTLAKSEPGGSDINIPGKGTLRWKALEYTEKKTRKKAPELKKGALKALGQTPEVGAKVEQTGKKKVSKGVTWEGEISKVDTDKRQVFGWASVVEVNGKPVEDLQGDYIDIDEMEKSAYDYVIKSRKGGDMHLRDGEQPVHVSDMIESFIVTPEKKEKLGLPDEMPTGWWVGFQVNDDNAWNLVKSKGRTGFSIHGRGQRTPIEDFGKALIEPPPHQRRVEGGKHKGPRSKNMISMTNRSKKKHKFKAPTPGRGKYVNAPNNPHWSHNAANARFWANAAINNPGPATAGVAAGAAAVGQSQRKKLSDDNKRRVDTATGAAAAGGTAQVVGNKRMYGKLREMQKPERNLDWADPKDIRNPSKSLPAAEKKKFNALKSGARKAQAAAGGGEQGKRAWAQHFNANFPEGYESSKVRRDVASGKTIRRINRGSLIAAAAGGGAVYGGHKINEKRKSDGR